MKEWVIIGFYFIMGALLGAGLTLLFLENHYAKQVNDYIELVNKTCTFNTVVAWTEIGT